MNAHKDALQGIDRTAFLLRLLTFTDASSKLVEMGTSLGEEFEVFGWLEESSAWPWAKQRSFII
ncbi:unnamed protein product [Larinioides sclopetarius]|uniref:Uncharacterized protein n=1 Tax=Larinioides sclopetarius TaxID=280406 RepID=A0AAV2B1G7_9ARAC